MPKIIVCIDTDTHKVVPIEPTQEMLKAIAAPHISQMISYDYHHIISAAPPVEPLKPIGVKFIIGTTAEVMLARNSEDCEYFMKFCREARPDAKLSYIYEGE